MSQPAIKAFGRCDLAIQIAPAIRNPGTQADSDTSGTRVNKNQKKRQGTTETILVVEDNLDIQALARRFLEKAGYSVVTASDGVEGLSIYKQLRSSIGLLLTDVTMPKMNGLDLADHILQLDSLLPVLFMSGDAFCSDGSFECIPKPFAPGKLVGSVGKALDVSEKRREKEHVR